MKGRRTRAGSFILLLFLTACSLNHGANSTPTVSPSASLTATLTLTATYPLPPTWTLIPSLTPTQTLAPTATQTPTPSETPIPSAPAVLFSYHDVEGNLIDWSYSRISSHTVTGDGSTQTLSAYLAFQLLDRGVHRQTLTFDGKAMTLYYLNVQHNFDGTLKPVKLILSATYGKDVPIALIPAGGASYFSLRLLSYQQNFDALNFHAQANRAYTQRLWLFSDELLIDFEKLLPTLPTDLIVLSDSNILYDSDTLTSYTFKVQLDTVPYLAAREMPYISLDAYNRVVGSSPEALALVDYVVSHKLLSGDVPYFGSDALVLLVKSDTLPTLP